MIDKIAQGSAPDLFDYATRYPQAPGYRRRSDTSKAAADAMRARAPTLRQRVLQALITDGPMTPDECAKVLGVSVLACRPRFSELDRLGLIVPVDGMRRRNESGLMAQVYRASAIAQA